MKTLKGIIFNNVTRNAVTKKKEKAYEEYNAVRDMANTEYDEACKKIENARIAAADDLQKIQDADYVDMAAIKKAEEEFDRIYAKSQAEFEKAQQIHIHTIMAAEAELLRRYKDADEADVEKGIEYFDAEPAAEEDVSEANKTKENSRESEITAEINNINDMFARYDDGNPDNFTAKDVALLTEEANYWYAELYGKLSVSIKMTGLLIDRETGEPTYADDVELPLNYYTYPTNTLLGQFASYMLPELLDKMAASSMYPDDVEVAMLVNGHTVRTIQFSDYDKMMSLIF